MGRFLARLYDRGHGPETAGRCLVEIRINDLGCVCLAGLSIRRVERDILRDLSLPAVAVCEQAFLVVVELLRCLGTFPRASERSQVPQNVAARAQGEQIGIASHTWLIP